jgi:hypothetical protein
MLHPFPGHERFAFPEAFAVTVQPPPAHVKKHGPLPPQRKLQPEVGQLRVHASEVTHWHVCPFAQLVELVSAVVTEHAARTGTSANRRAKRGRINQGYRESTRGPAARQGCGAARCGGGGRVLSGTLALARSTVCVDTVPRVLSAAAGTDTFE